MWYLWDISRIYLGYLRIILLFAGESILCPAARHSRNHTNYTSPTPPLGPNSKSTGINAPVPLLFNGLRAREATITAGQRPFTYLCREQILVMDIKNNILKRLVIRL